MTIKWHGYKIIFFSFLVFTLFSCANTSSISKVFKIPITKKGEMSTVVLFLVKHQNIICDGDETYTFPDGLAFYFLIFPVKPEISPTIKQFQNFTIDSEPYWQNIPGSVNSQTTIYNERTFAEHENEVFLKVKKNKNTKMFVQKTIICGLTIPSKGIIVYQLFFGFEDTVEEFEFRFSLADVR